MSSESDTTGDPAVASAPAGATKPEKKPRSFLRELPILILVALVLSFLLQTFIARVYLIPSESMEPTLHGCAGCTGDRIVVEKVGYHFGEPQPGDVIVFVVPTPGRRISSPFVPRMWWFAAPRNSVHWSASCRRTRTTWSSE